MANQVYGINDDLAQHHDDHGEMLDDTEKRSSARRYEPKAIMQGHRLRRVISHFEAERYYCSMLEV